MQASTDEGYALGVISTAHYYINPVGVWLPWDPLSFTGPPLKDLLPLNAKLPTQEPLEGTHSKHSLNTTALYTVVCC